MPENQVPEKEQTQIKNTDEVRSFVSNLVSDVMTDDLDRSVYLDKLEAAWAQRLMLIGDEDVPWPGAPNFSMPFTDKMIRKRKPPLVSSMLNPKKMAVVTVEDGVPDPTGELEQKAKRAEDALNLFLRKRMDWLESLVLGVDYMLEKGRVYFKVFEKFESKIVNRTVDVKSFRVRLGDEVVDAAKKMKDREVIELLLVNTGFGFDIENDDHVAIMKDIVKRFKSGEEEIDFQMEIINSGPKIEAIPPERIILPTNSPRNIQLVSRFTHEFFMNEQQLEAAVESGQFDEKVVERGIADNRSNQDVDKRPIEVDKDVEEGISPSIDDEADNYKIWEIHTYWKKKGSDRMEKYVVTTFAKDTTGQYLRVIREPNDEDVFPLVAVDHEIRDDRALSSRGIPEMLRFVQAIIDMQENNRMRRDIVQNTPFFTIRRQSGITSNAIQFMPGQGLVVDNHDDLLKQNPANGVEINAERIESSAKQFGEEYLGSIDFAFAGAQNTGVGVGARTLGEIQTAQAEASKITSLDFIVFNEGVGKVYEMVFQLLRSSMSQPIEVNGQLVTKEDFNFPFEVRANGNLEQSDKQAMLQRAMNLMQIVNSQDPTFTTLEDRYNAYIDVLEAFEVNDVESLSTNPSSVLQDQTVQLQQQVAQLQQQVQVMVAQLQEGTKDLAKIKQDQQKQVIENQVKKETPSLKTRIIRTVENNR